MTPPPTLLTAHPLAAVPLFERVSATDCEEILASGRLVSRERGASFFRQGDPAERFFVVRSTINISGSGLSIAGGIFDGSNAAITITGPVTLTGGQFKAPNATVTVFGIAVGTQGNIAFTAANSTILLSGSGNQAVDFGNDPIYNLTAANTGGTVSFTRAFTAGAGSTATFLPGSSVAFPTTGTTTFSNIAWYGTAAQPITLTSTTAGATATIQVQQTAPRVSYVQVKDITVAGTAITVFAGTDNGHNANWVFSTTALVTLTQSDGTTAVTEGGVTDTYTLVLGAQPTANVTVTLNGGTQLATDVASVVFTPANWNLPQTVTVQAIDDAVFGWNHTGTLHHTIASTDGLYNNFVVADLTVQITDNDQPVLAITSPVAGEQVHGQINVAVQLTSVVAGQARLVVDTTAGDLQAVGQTDFTLPWDTATVADGDHMIKVEFVPDGFPALTFATAAVTVRVIQDAVPPIFANFAPANNAFTNVAKTTISADYSDVGSGVNTTILAVTLDGNPITVTANATGFTYTSADDLADGAHAVHATVQDNAGNSATADWAFTVDTVDPTVSAFEPSFFSTLTVKRPAISMTLADLTSGIKTASIVFKLDDVVEAATATATSVAFTPATDLADGNHTYFVHVEDKAGNITELTAPFMIDTTPPDAPTITYTFESATEVVAAGPVPVGQGIADLTVSVTAANTTPTDVGSSVVLNGDAFLVTFAKVNAGVTTFTAEFRFKDDVGNPSAATTASFAFNSIITPGNPGPANPPAGVTPAAPQVSNLVIADSSLTGDKTGTDAANNPVSYTNKATVHVTVQVCTSLGVIDSVTFTGGSANVTVAGNNAAADTFETDVPVTTEGTYTLSVSAIGKNDDLNVTGNLPSDQQKTLLVDRTAPTVAYTLPTRYSLTDDKDIVYLNGGQPADNATLRSSRGVNCFAPSEFVIAANVSDFCGLSSTVNAPAAKITGAATADLTVTVQAPTNPGDSETISLSTPSATLPESVVMNNGVGIAATGFNNAYLFQLKLTDKAGNALNAPANPDYQNQFRIWVDRTPPDAIPGKLLTGHVNVSENTASQTQLSHAHWFVSTYDAAEGWQDTKDDAHRVLRSYKGAAPQLSGQTQLLPTNIADATNAQSAWLFNLNLDHPLVPSGGLASPTIYLRDAAGNYSGAIHLIYGRVSIEETTPTSGHNEPATLPGEQGFIREMLASDKVQWHFNSSTTTPEVDLKTSAGTNLEGIRSLLKTPSATIQVQAYYDYFDPGDEYNPNGAVYVVGPMDPGPANDPHVSPRVVTLPPSFQTTPVAQPARFKDNTIREVLDLASSSGLYAYPAVKVGLKSRDFAANSLSDLSLATAYATGSDTLYLPALPMENAVPGWSRVTYAISAEGYTGNGSYEQCAWTSGAGGGVDYGINVIGLRPDMVATGNTVTLRFSAGFLSKDYPIDQFEREHNNTQFVHFVNSASGLDVSILQDPNLTADLDPTKITILRDAAGNLRQRLVIDQGQNETTVQTLEIDVHLGETLGLGICHVDIKVGAIHSYLEPHGSPGLNDAYRMQNSFDVIRMRFIDLSGNTINIIDPLGDNIVQEALENDPTVHAPTNGIRYKAPVFIELSLPSGFDDNILDSITAKVINRADGQILEFEMTEDDKASMTFSNPDSSFKITLVESTTFGNNPKLLSDANAESILTKVTSTLFGKPFAATVILNEDDLNSRHFRTPELSGDFSITKMQNGIQSLDLNVSFIGTTFSQNLLQVNETLFSNANYSVRFLKSPAADLPEELKDYRINKLLGRVDATNNNSASYLFFAFETSLNSGHFSLYLVPNATTAIQISPNTPYGDDAPTIENVDRVVRDYKAYKITIEGLPSLMPPLNDITVSSIDAHENVKESVDIQLVADTGTPGVFITARPILPVEGTDKQATLDRYGDEYTLLEASENKAQWFYDRMETRLELQTMGYVLFIGDSLGAGMQSANLKLLYEHRSFARRFASQFFWRYKSRDFDRNGYPGTPFFDKNNTDKLGHTIEVDQPTMQLPYYGTLKFNEEVLTRGLLHSSATNETFDQLTNICVPGFEIQNLLVTTNMPKKLYTGENPAEAQPNRPTPLAERSIRFNEVILGKGQTPPETIVGRSYQNIIVVSIGANDLLEAIVKAPFGDPDAVKLDDFIASYPDVFDQQWSAENCDVPLRVQAVVNTHYPYPDHRIEKLAPASNHYSNPDFFEYVTSPKRFKEQLKKLLDQIEAEYKKSVRFKDREDVLKPIVFLMKVPDVTKAPILAPISTTPTRVGPLPFDLDSDAGASTFLENITYSVKPNPDKPNETYNNAKVSLLAVFDQAVVDQNSYFQGLNDYFHSQTDFGGFKPTKYDMLTGQNHLDVVLSPEFVLSDQELNFIQQTRERYNQAMEEFAGSPSAYYPHLRIILVDVDDAFNVPTSKVLQPTRTGGLFSMDMVHPNSQGYKLLCAQFTNVVKSMIQNHQFFGYEKPIPWDLSLEGMPP